MNNERIEVSLGLDTGNKVFNSFEEAEEWLAKEREFWVFLQKEQNQTREGQTIWQTIEQRFGRLNQVLTEARTARARAAEELKRFTAQALVPSSSGEVQALTQPQPKFDPAPHYNKIKELFRELFDLHRAISSCSPRAKFLRQLAEERGARVALFACGFFMRVGLEYRTLEMLNGALAASYYEQGFTSPVPHEQEALGQLRSNWERQFQGLRDKLAEETEKHQRLNLEAISLIQKHQAAGDALLQKQQKEGDALLRKEEHEWAELHKTYDDKLAFEKPVSYWMKKATSHCRLAWIFGIISFVVVGAVFYLLYELLQITLRVPAGTKDPLTWHPEYWRIGVLIAAGVFSVWVVRIFVRLFLSHVHLLADANERVTMANTYLALLRNKQGVQENDRQLILQTLFRPSTTGVVKDDGVPLSWMEAVTKLGR